MVVTHPGDRGTAGWRLWALAPSHSPSDSVSPSRKPGCDLDSVLKALCHWGCCNEADMILVLVLPLTNSVTLEESFHLSVPHCKGRKWCPL